MPSSPGYKHGHASGPQKSREYHSWRAMRSRCLNPDDPAYPRYGAQGITICERWNTFENFLADMGSRPQGMSLDREDGTKGYTPDNCRWATPQQQMLNTKTAHKIKIAGQVQSLGAWCRYYKIDPNAVRWRMRNFGWDYEKAITTPKERKHAVL